MGTVSCTCGLQWRFGHHPHGHVIYWKPATGATWRLLPEGLWPGSIELFKCRCERRLGQNAAD